MRENFETDEGKFRDWLGDRAGILSPGLKVEPTIKVLSFLALHSADESCSYDDIKRIFEQHQVIKTGEVPNVSLRSALHSLGIALKESGHPLQLARTGRGTFQLVPNNEPMGAKRIEDERALILEHPAINATEVARQIVEDGRIPFQALYFLEWSARWWEAYSGEEAEIRAPYECSSIEKLGVLKRLFPDRRERMCFLSLAPGEGLAEIRILKELLRNSHGEEAESEQIQIHYLAIDSSPRLLRDHIGLVKEAFRPELRAGNLICAGVVADIFTGIAQSVDEVRAKFSGRAKGTIPRGGKFFDESWPVLVTYLGNCLGNEQFNEHRIFSSVYSSLLHRPLEFLVGVSIMHGEKESYKRIWDDFLLQTPRHLLDANLLISHQTPESKALREFELAEEGMPRFGDINNRRCPEVVPRDYQPFDGIRGQVYSFEYRLEFDLSTAIEGVKRPATSLVTLYDIIKYDLKSLANGIRRRGIFEVEFIDEGESPDYAALIVETENGKRKYQVFSAFLSEGNR